MSVNNATKYSQLVDEKFYKEAITPALTNKDFDWNGVKSVVVYSYETVAQSDFDGSGVNQYGTPAEISNNVQTMTVGVDRVFSFRIDKKNTHDPMLTAEAGAQLARQMNEVSIPEIDRYVFAKMLANAGGSSATVINTTNAFTQLVAGRKFCVNKKVPVNQLICVASTTYYAKLLSDTTNFIKAGDLAQTVLITGQVGKCAGLPVIEVPDEYLSGAEFIIVAPIATTVPMKIEEFRILENQRGVRGAVCEGSFNYDAFVRTNKKNAIYYNAGVIESSYAAGADATHTVVTHNIDLTMTGKAGLELVYKADFATAEAATTTIGSDLTAWTAVPSTGILTTATTKFSQIALRDATTKKAVTYSAALVVAVGS